MFQVIAEDGKARQSRYRRNKRRGKIYLEIHV